MVNTHLTFYQLCSCGSCAIPHKLDIILPGTPDLSPYLEINGNAFTLYASYTHSDGTVENVYHSLFSTHASSH
ncbi:hypothetical protein [Spirosoma endophyticum]|uniref:Uncharacterized protein n=1 Tax=Spirosoma endophyticum TaxID=662367 RepID=A0A1I2H833_9BACT|nr:hypothetical protein [Spirosoma endophyticum]SFF25832.1 hypothetical protein SAMN05216167_13912 [Spirosoma endophyticum]